MERKIVMTGAQGTGKTTVLNIFKEIGYPVVTEVVRKLHRERGISINTNGNDDSQMLIWNTYKEILATTPKYVSDRGLTDVISYTKDGVTEGSVSEELYLKQLEELRTFIQEHPDILYVYFPIEFAVVNDGVRSMDEDYRRRIDVNIHGILDELGIDYLTVTGTPEERYNQIINWAGPDMV